MGFKLFDTLPKILICIFASSGLALANEVTPSFQEALNREPAREKPKEIKLEASSGQQKNLEEPLFLGIKRKTVVSTLYGLSGAVAATSLGQIQPSIERNEFTYLQPIGAGLMLWGAGVFLEFE